MPKKVLLLSVVLFALLAAFTDKRGGQADPLTEYPYKFYLPLISSPELPLWIGPDGGSIVCLTVSASNPQVMYAGTWGAGVFRTEDGGASWKPVNRGMPNLLINAIEVDPKNPNVVYAGPYRAKLYKTVDGGENWFLASKGIQAEAIVYAMAIDPVDTSIVYATTRGISNNGSPPWNGEVYKSEDGGGSWKIILFNIGDSEDWAYDVAVHPNSPNMVFTAMHERGGVYFSADYGENFVPRNNGMIDLSGRALAINPYTVNVDQVTLYFGTWHTAGVQKSFNTGLNWQGASNGSFLAKIYRMAINPLTPETLYLATWNNIGVLKTTNGGGEWNPVGLAQDQIYTVEIDPKNPNTVYAGTSGDGLYRSTNAGSSWSHRHTGISNTSVNTILVQPDATKSVYISIKEGGISRRLEEGQPWQDYTLNLPERDINGLVRNPGNLNLLYALTDHSGIWRVNVSTSSSWERIDHDLPPAPGTDWFYSPDHPFAGREDLEAEVELAASEAYDPSLQPEAVLDETAPVLAMAFAPSNPNRVYAGVASVDTPYSGVYFSDNGGVSWSPTTMWGHTAWGIAVSPTDPNELYVTTSSPGVVRYSTNGGASWENTGLRSYVWGVYAVVIPPQDPQRVFVGTSDGIYVRVNNGEWTQSGLAGKPVAVLVAHPEKANVLLAGTTAGVYVTYDLGKTWEQLEALLASSTIQSISFDPLDSHHIYIGTKTSGAVRLYLP